MSTKTLRRSHILTVTRSDDWHPDYPEFDTSITCVTPELCNGWMECFGDHSDAPDDGSDEAVLHGEHHDYYSHAGWVVPFNGCVVATCDNQDDAWDIARVHGVGHYDVDDDWGDPGELHLFLIERLPDYARAERVLRILGAAA